MYKVFHRLAGSYFDAADIKYCLDMASAMRLQLPDLLFTIYLVTNHQLDTLIGVEGLTYTKDSFTYSNIHGTIETAQSYKSKQGREVVLAICMLEEKSLINIQESPSLFCLFVVPEMPGYLDHWLQLHSAIDVSTPSLKSYPGVPSCPTELKRTIGYLKDYTRKSNVNLTYTPIQQGILISVSNAYRTNAPKVQFDEVYAECLRRDLSHKEAEIVAKAISRVTSFTGVTITRWDAINDSQWENN